MIIKVSCSLENISQFKEKSRPLKQKITVIQCDVYNNKTEGKLNYLCREVLGKKVFNRKETVL